MNSPSSFGTITEDNITTCHQYGASRGRSVNTHLRASSSTLGAQLLISGSPLLISGAPLLISGAPSLFTDALFTVSSERADKASLAIASSLYRYLYVIRIHCGPVRTYVFLPLDDLKASTSAKSETQTTRQKIAHLVLLLWRSPGSLTVSTVSATRLRLVVIIICVNSGRACKGRRASKGRITETIFVETTSKGRDSLNAFELALQVEEYQAAHRSPCSRLMRIERTYR